MCSTENCLTLILAAIVLWQNKEVERVLADAEDEGALDFDLLARWKCLPALFMRSGLNRDAYSRLSIWHGIGLPC